MSNYLVNLIGERSKFWVAYASALPWADISIIKLVYHGFPHGPSPFLLQGLSRIFSTFKPSFLFSDIA